MDQQQMQISGYSWSKDWRFWSVIALSIAGGIAATVAITRMENDRPFSTESPKADQVLQYSAAMKKWVPADYLPAAKGAQITPAVGARLVTVNQALSKSAEPSFKSVAGHVYLARPGATGAIPILPPVRITGTWSKPSSGDMAQPANMEDTPTLAKVLLTGVAGGAASTVEPVAGSLDATALCVLYLPEPVPATAAAPDNSMHLPRLAQAVAGELTAAAQTTFIPAAGASPVSALKAFLAADQYLGTAANAGRSLADKAKPNVVFAGLTVRGAAPYVQIGRMGADTVRWRQIFDSSVSTDTAAALRIDRSAADDFSGPVNCLNVRRTGEVYVPWILVQNAKYVSAPLLGADNVAHLAGDISYCRVNGFTIIRFSAAPVALVAKAEPTAGTLALWACPDGYRPAADQVFDVFMREGAVEVHAKLTIAAGGAITLARMTGNLTGIVEGARLGLLCERTVVFPHA